MNARRKFRAASVTPEVEPTPACGPSPAAPAARAGSRGKATPSSGSMPGARASRASQRQPGSRAHSATNAAAPFRREPSLHWTWKRASSAARSAAGRPSGATSPLMSTKPQGPVALPLRQAPEMADLALAQRAGAVVQHSQRVVRRGRVHGDDYRPPQSPVQGAASATASPGAPAGLRADLHLGPGACPAAPPAHRPAAGRAGFAGQAGLVATEVRTRWRHDQVEWDADACKTERSRSVVDLRPCSGVPWEWGPADSPQCESNPRHRALGSPQRGGALTRRRSPPLPRAASPPGCAPRRRRSSPRRTR